MSLGEKTPAIYILQKAIADAERLLEDSKAAIRGYEQRIAHEMEQTSSTKTYLEALYAAIEVLREHS